MVRYDEDLWVGGKWELHEVKRERFEAVRRWIHLEHVVPIWPIRLGGGAVELRSALNL